MTTSFNFGRWLLPNMSSTQALHGKYKSFYTSPLTLSDNNFMYLSGGGKAYIYQVLGGVFSANNQRGTSFNLTDSSFLACFTLISSYTCVTSVLISIKAHFSFITVIAVHQILQLFKATSVLFFEQISLFWLSIKAQPPP